MATESNSRFLGTIPLVVTNCLFSFSAYAKYSGGTGEGIVNFMLERTRLLSVTDSTEVGG